MFKIKYIINFILFRLEENQNELRKKEEVCKFRLEQIDSYQKKL